jgi:hypothetical protein
MARNVILFFPRIILVSPKSAMEPEHYAALYHCNPVKISDYPITGFFHCYGNFS